MYNKNTFLKITALMYKQEHISENYSYMKVKEESKKVGLKLSIQKTKIVASSRITSWQIDRETVETVADFIFVGFQNHCRW